MRDLLARRTRHGLTAVLLAATILSGCAVSAEDAATGRPTDAALDDPEPVASPDDDASPDAAPADQAEATDPEDPASPATPAMTDGELAAAGVNELGRVLVMEWHKIQEADGRWENSLATFRAQLEELQARGYRPISIDEFISGRFDIPAGTSPVLLTFDDSYREHFFFGADGTTPDPDSVVGILEAMEAEDPTWRARAVFSFYWPVPFRDTDREVIEAKLRYLVEHGYDLANHTYNHDNLRDMTDTEVVENLARAERELAQVVGADYRVRSITLTQGIWPQTPELAMSGTSTEDGFTYEHAIAFEVGFMPTRSPHHADYDPWSVQRVQAYIPEFRTWVDWLDAEPGRRLVSDGDPDTVTFPAEWSDVAAPQDGVEVRSYVGAPAAAATCEPDCAVVGTEHRDQG